MLLCKTKKTFSRAENGRAIIEPSLNGYFRLKSYASFYREFPISSDTHLGLPFMAIRVTRELERWVILQKSLVNFANDIQYGRPDRQERVISTFSVATDF